MPRATRTVATVLAMAIVGWASAAEATESGDDAAGRQPLMPPAAHVRGASDRLAAAIREAAEGSPTFRHVVDQLGHTDGIVYVMDGGCKRGLRACLLLAMSAMGPNRVLWIHIDPRKVDRDLVGSIGHELQHALEVLTHRGIRSGSAMTLFYKKEASNDGGHFETDAAIKIGNAVRAELQAHAGADLRTENAGRRRADRERCPPVRDFTRRRIGACGPQRSCASGTGSE